VAKDSGGTVRCGWEWAGADPGSPRWFGLFLLPALLLPGPGEAQDPGSPDPRVDVEAVVASLEPEIRRAMLEGQIPSMTVALVAGDQVIWSEGFGESNLRARTPAAPSTVYIIASTFKTMATAALLQLHEEGRFGLGDPVRDYLTDLEIQDEAPDDPVTFRHLLTHTSGLPTVFSPAPLWADTVPTPMDRYLEERLQVVGPPMERVRYSNMAYTLLARLVEEISGTDFREFVRKRVFDPATMESTHFAPTADMMERIAVPYAPDSSSGRLAPVDMTRFAEWPAGGVWGTVLDQARWLIVNLNGGAIEGERILSEEILEATHTHQFPQFRGPMAGGWGGEDAGYGLTWWTATRNGDRYFAHSGSVRGYTAFIHGNRDRRLGVAILSNGNRAHEHLVRLSFLATDLMARHDRARTDGGR
jgi:CubicO group peptidase (beta-lactamase class C family)